MKVTVKKLFLFVVFIFGLNIASTMPGSAQESPDTIYFNANIYTVDAVNRVAQAIAIAGDRFVKVGSNEEVLALALANTRKVDLKGKTVIPGLIDSHLHPMRLASNLDKVDLWNAKSVADVVRLIGERVKSTPKGEWVEAASLWHEGQLKENRFPTRWELDAVSPDNPVFIPRGGHNVVANSYALRLAGITKATPDPPGGHIERDKKSGEPTGYLLERPAFAKVRAMLPRPKPEQTVAAFKKAMNLLNSVGVTSAREAAGVPPFIKAYAMMRDRGLLTVRLSYLVVVSPKSPAKVDIGRLEKMKGGLPKDDHWLRFDGVKMVGDGGVEAAMLRQPYKNKPDFRGIPVTPVEKMRQIALWAQDAGWPVNIHCVGGRCIDEVLGIYEEANARRSILNARWKIEHSWMPNMKNIAQIRRLGIKVTIQPVHIYTLAIGLMDYWGKPRTDQLMPTKTYLENGIALGGGTDSPVTPYNSFLAMWVGATRKSRGGDVLGANHGLGAAQLLRMHTINSAAITGEDHIKGSIESGKLADFVVLSDDLLNIPSDKIKDVQAMLTVVGGKEVFKR